MTECRRVRACGGKVARPRQRRTQLWPPCECALTDPNPPSSPLQTHSYEELGTFCLRKSDLILEVISGLCSLSLEVVIATPEAQ